MTTPLYFFICLFSNAISDHGVNFQNACENITLRDNRIFLDVTIEKQNKVFYLDFGAIKSDMSGTDNLKSQSVSNSLFSGEMVFGKSDELSQTCQAMPVATGCFGFDLFRKSQQVFHLDFDNSRLCCVSIDQTTTLIQNGYREIKCNFQKDGVYIAIIIRKKNYYLKFDTGYSGNIMMSADDAAPFSKDICKSYLNSDGDFKVYPNKWITVDKSFYNSTITVKEIRKSLIGMGLIKGFNWIIDFRNQKVYLRKNGLGLDAQNSFPPDYQADIKNGNLIIVGLNRKLSKVRLGDHIVKVNGINVTAENSCNLKAFIERNANNGNIDFEISPLN
jgi:hypothetical protein